MLLLAAPSSEAADEQPEERSATNLTQTLAADSGVSIQTLCTNCNNADLSLGGLDDDLLAVTCDGVPVLGGLAQIYLLSVMPVTAIDNVAVKRGAGEP